MSRGQIYHLWASLELATCNFAWNLDLGPWNLELGAWSLELGAWSLELGTWSLELGTWSLELGTWSLELGTWNLELATWNLKLGTWNLELGAWSLGLETFSLLRDPAKAEEAAHDVQRFLTFDNIMNGLISPRNFGVADISNGNFYACLAGPGIGKTNKLIPGIGCYTCNGELCLLTSKQHQARDPPQSLLTHPVAYPTVPEATH